MATSKEAEERMVKAVTIALRVVKDAWYIRSDMRVYGTMSGDTILKSAAILASKIYDELKNSEINALREKLAGSR